MPVTIKVDPIDRDVQVMLNEDLSPEAQARAMQEFARAQIDEADNVNRTVLGRIPHRTIAIDGTMDASLTQAKASSVIVVEYDLLVDVLVWIGEQLRQNSPVKTGRYRDSHALFADGAEIAIGQMVPAAEEYVFINTVPYSRKIELGLSSQAPDGVYQAVASLARRRFGNVAKIDFSYRTALGGSIIGGHAGNKSSQRNPAIIVKTGGR